MLSKGHKQFFKPVQGPIRSKGSIKYDALCAGSGSVWRCLWNAIFPCTKCVRVYSRFTKKYCAFSCTSTFISVTVFIGYYYYYYYHHHHHHHSHFSELYFSLGNSKRVRKVKIDTDRFESSRHPSIHPSINSSNHHITLRHFNSIFICVLWFSKWHLSFRVSE